MTASTTYWIYSVDEFKIIKNFIKKQSDEQVIMGQGDDCSVVDFDINNFMIETTDCLVEDVHFRRSHMSFAELAYKSLAVNISDISAMGGKPNWAHLSLALPKNVVEEEVKDFFDSFYDLAAQHNISLLGGDLSSSPHSIFVNIHLSGFVNKSDIKYRSGLSQKGVLCVTGNLGDSSAGLHCLEKALSGSVEEVLKGKHKSPPIELAKAQWLAKQKGVLGMMDLSDGLLSDLSRIPGCGIKINLENIPQSVELKSFAEQLKVDSLRWSLAGGEDYRILFSCTHSSLESMKSQYKDEFGQVFCEIGEVAPEGREIEYFKNNELQKIDFKPFEHFSRS